MTDINPSWSRGECRDCGKDMLLARAYPTTGPQQCEACEVSESAWEEAEKHFRAKAAEVVAELRQRATEVFNAPGPESDSSYFERCDGGKDAFCEAADLVAEKLVGGK